MSHQAALTGRPSEFTKERAEKALEPPAQIENQANRMIERARRRRRSSRKRQKRKKRNRRRKGEDRGEGNRERGRE